MEVLYNEDIIRHLKFIKKKTPNRIWFEASYYVFDYGILCFYYGALPKELDSPNSFNCAFLPFLERREERYQPSEKAILICSDQSISEIYALRTVVVFKKLKWSRPLKTIVLLFKYYGSKLFSSNVIKHLARLNEHKMNYIKFIHPIHQLSEYKNLPKINIVDIGLVLNIGEKYLYIDCSDHTFYHKFMGFRKFPLFIFDEFSDYFELIDIENY